MPRRCNVCTHLDAFDVNMAILRGDDSMRGIARRFGLDDASVTRYAQNHLAQEIARVRVQSALNLQKLSEEFERSLTWLSQTLNDAAAYLPLLDPASLTLTQRAFRLLRLRAAAVMHARERRSAELDALLRESCQRFELYREVAVEAGVALEPDTLVEVVLAGFPTHEYGNKARAIIEGELKRYGKSAAL